MSEPKVKPITALKMLDIIQRRRYVPNTQFYFTNRKVSATVAAAAAAVDASRGRKRGSPFRLPRSEKLVSYIKYSDQKEAAAARRKALLPVRLKDDIKVAQSRDISQRLYINPPLDDVRTVLELHPEFYSVIEGRPIRMFDDIKVYMNSIRGYALLRQQIGYRNDIAIKIENGVREELKQYEAISASYKRHVKDFELFLREDYQKSVVKVRLAEKVSQELTAINSEFLGYVSSLNLLKNIVFKLDSIRNVQKMYRKYLFHVAPLSWREQYDETYHKKSTQFDSDIEKSAMNAGTEIGIIMQKATVELANPPKPHLYFNDPDQMMYLFRSLELQSGEYLIHLSRMNAPMATLGEIARRLRSAMAEEQDHFHYYIQRLTAAIQRECDNETILKHMFFDILNGPFIETVASPESLKLKICIEYVFDQVFGKSEDIHQNIREPMKLLELMYEEYNLKLDSLDFTIVKSAQNDFFSMDLRTMTLAYLAARELRSFDEMSNLIRKAFLPPFKAFRLKPALVERKVIVQDLTHTEDAVITTRLTENDKQNLCIFTEWCEGQDPTLFMKEYKKYVKHVIETKY